MGGGSDKSEIDTLISQLTSDEKETRHTAVVNLTDLDSETKVQNGAVEQLARLLQTPTSYVMDDPLVRDYLLSEIEELANPERLTKVTPCIVEYFNSSYTSDHQRTADEVVDLLCTSISAHSEMNQPLPDLSPVLLTDVLTDQHLVRITQHLKCYFNETNISVITSNLQTIDALSLLFNNTDYIRGTTSERHTVQINVWCILSKIPPELSEKSTENFVERRIENLIGGMRTLLYHILNPLETNSNVCGLLHILRKLVEYNLAVEVLQVTISDIQKDSKGYPSPIEIMLTTVLDKSTNIENIHRLIGESRSIPDTEVETHQKDIHQRILLLLDQLVRTRRNFVESTLPVGIELAHRTPYEEIQDNAIEFIIYSIERNPAHFRCLVKQRSAYHTHILRRLCDLDSEYRAGIITSVLGVLADIIKKDPAELIPDEDIILDETPIESIITQSWKVIETSDAKDEVVDSALITLEYFSKEINKLDNDQNIALFPIPEDLLRRCLRTIVDYVEHNADPDRHRRALRILANANKLRLGPHFGKNEEEISTITRMFERTHNWEERYLTALICQKIATQVPNAFSEKDIKRIERCLISAEDDPNAGETITPLLSTMKEIADDARGRESSEFKNYYETHNDIQPLVETLGKQAEVDRTRNRSALSTLEALMELRDDVRESFE